MKNTLFAPDSRRVTLPVLWGALTCLTFTLLASGCSLALAGTLDDEGPGFWRILDTRQVGANTFLRAHPEWDGRGAVVAVLDTGVDMGVAGLRETPDGQVKVVDARDFSRQGDLLLAPAEVQEFDGVPYLTTDEGKARGVQSLPTPPEGAAWSLGFLDESQLKNSSVTDLNQNGSDTDRYAIATIERDDGWVAYVDLDGDLDFTGATPIRSYHVAHETFTFHLQDPQDQRVPVTFSLHIEDDGTMVTLHYDDGGHGTHVAGIATGYGLMGRSGFNGIAPGAQVLSLKIGDNTLSGGATTTESMLRAIEFAGEWSEEHDTPVIINLSYGIGSEIEGASQIDLALDEALSKHSRLAASVSAGNEGPGLSTVGTPAGSHLATTVAAMLPKATAETLFGSRLSRDRIFAFSSRGGELSKPDVLAPGIASSSVPAFDGGDIKGGTSMSAPQIAGVYALMASAARATNTRFTGQTLKRALLHSAEPIPGYLPIEQGAGVPNVSRAVRALKQLSSRQEPFQVAGYHVSTEIPTSPRGVGPAAYWRTGTYLPPERSGHAFDIRAEFPDGTDADTIAGFQTMLQFRTDASWLRVDRSSARLIGDRAIHIKAHYEASALREPGVYSARIEGYPDDGAGIAAFGLWNTVVVPHTFHTGNNYALDQRGDVEPCGIKRIPLLVPPGATQMTIKMRTPRNKWGRTVLYLFDPAGREWPIDAYLASSEDGQEVLARVGGADLEAGVWEVVAYGSFRNQSTSHYELAVRFRGFDAPAVTSLHLEPGQNPTGQVQVTNRYDTRFSGTAAGSLTGFRRTRNRRVEGDGLTETYHLNAEIQRIDLELRLSPETYNRFTDVAVTVLDSNENAIVREGFSNGVLRLSIPKQHETNYLRITGALTEDDGEPWTVSIRETYVWAQPVGVMVGGQVVLYPQVQQRLPFTLSRTPPQAPEGFQVYGEIRFKDERTREVWLTVPMHLE